MSNKKYTLVINPGATSTKAAIYEGENEVFTENLSTPLRRSRSLRKSPTSSTIARPLSSTW